MSTCFELTHINQISLGHYKIDFSIASQDYMFANDGGSVDVLVRGRTQFHSQPESNGEKMKEREVTGIL